MLTAGNGPAWKSAAKGGDGRTYSDAAWSLTTYTFKRLVPPYADAVVQSWSPSRLAPSCAL